jgi:hypothetical protein
MNDSYDLSAFSLQDMTRCGAELRKQSADASSMEEVADKVVRLLHEKLRTPSGERACALVRTFVTLPYSELQAEQQLFARKLFPEITQRPEVKCLTLLATAGDESAWNSRRASVGHQALPLPSEQSISRSPMISQLIRQLNVDVNELLQPGANVMLDASQHTFNVFHIPDAVDNEFIPAQSEFVKPFGIRSVLGFGGLLLPGELFATILFTKTPISREVAELFKTLALNVKVALLPFTSERVFG